MSKSIGNGKLINANPPFNSKIGNGPLIDKIRQFTGAQDRGWTGKRRVITNIAPPVAPPKEKVVGKPRIGSFFVTINTNKAGVGQVRRGSKVGMTEEGYGEFVVKFKNVLDQLWDLDYAFDNEIIQIGRFTESAKKKGTIDDINSDWPMIVKQYNVESNIQTGPIKQRVHAHCVVEVVMDSSWVLNPDAWINGKNLMKHFRILAEQEGMGQKKPYINIRGIKGNMKTLLSYARRDNLKESQFTEAYKKLHPVSRVVPLDDFDLNNDYGDNIDWEAEIVPDLESE
jgi:hypothetical protein